MASSKVLCGPCGYNDISKDAHKWCTSCQEGFCKDCEKMHKATKSRNHKLIGIDDYHKISGQFFIQMCDEHEKTLDRYCKSHDIAICLSCEFHHSSCGDIIPLKDAVKNFKISTALFDLEETISVALKNIESLIQNTSSEHLRQQEKKIKDQIKGIRNRINRHLDVMEKNLILELESNLEAHKSMHGEVSNRLKEMDKTINRLKEQTTEMRKLGSNLQIFLGTRQIEREAHKCLQLMSKYNTLNKYIVNFEINQVLATLLSDVKTFGKIKIEITKTDIPLLHPKIDQAQLPVHPVTKSISEIEVKLKQMFKIKYESTNMFITGCAILPNGHVLIADYSGEELLMQYNQNGTHVRDIPVSSQPYDVTVIDSDRVAVSYGRSSRTEILNIQNTTVEKKVDFNNYTYGLSYQGGKLYVVVYGRGIVVIELSGKIVNTININVNTVWYVATTTDRIYLSDWNVKTVACCDMSGTQLWVFQDDSLKNSSGLTVDTNKNVFVVGRDSHIVIIISHDGQTSKTLLSKFDGLFSPRAIDLNKRTGDLVVCNIDDAKTFVFKVTE